MRLEVVVNLCVREVTWAHSFLRGARAAGVPVVRSASEGSAALYIGDRVPHRSRAARVGYFLAAVSIAPCDDPSPQMRDREIATIERSDVVFILSMAEQAKLLAFAPKYASKLVVAGFPVNIRALRRMQITSRDQKLIAIAGQLRSIKNIQFERKVCAALIQRGFRCIHFTPDDEGQAIGGGVNMVRGLRGANFARALRHAGIFLSVSSYESLSVATIEACALGCVPVVPDHSGFQDWCPQDRRYQPDDVDDLLRCLAEASTEQAPRVDRYNPETFFATVRSAFDRLA